MEGRLQRTPGGDGSTSRFAAAGLVLGLTTWGVSLGVLVAGLPDPWPPTMWLPRGLSYPLTLAVLSVGGLVARRRPENPIGWAMLLGGVVGALQGLVSAVVVVAHAGAADALGAWAALGVEVLWPTMVVALVYVVARFPGTGRTRGDTAAAVLAALSVTTVTLHELLVAGPFQNVVWYDNPVGLLDDGAAALLESVAFLPFVALTIVSLVQVTRRAHRSRGIERQQFRWVLYGAVPLILSMVLVSLFHDGPVRAGDPLVALSTVGLSLLPVSIGVAILRYRLYELDRLISRTVTYVLLTGVVVGVWASIALLPTVVFDVGTPDGEPNDQLVAGATLLAAVTFVPLRRRLQDAIDHRLNRSRYDARRTVEALGTRLADRVDPVEVRREVAHVVGATLAPDRVAVWTPQKARRTT